MPELRQRRMKTIQRMRCFLTVYQSLIQPFQLFHAIESVLSMTWAYLGAICVDECANIRPIVTAQRPQTAFPCRCGLTNLGRVHSQESPVSNCRSETTNTYARPAKSNSYWHIGGISHLGAFLKMRSSKLD